MPSAGGSVASAGAGLAPGCFLRPPAVGRCLRLRGGFRSGAVSGVGSAGAASARRFFGLCFGSGCLAGFSGFASGAGSAGLAWRRLFSCLGLRCRLSLRLRRWFRLSCFLGFASGAGCGSGSGRRRLGLRRRLSLRLRLRRWLRLLVLPRLRFRCGLRFQFGRWLGPRSGLSSGCASGSALASPFVLPRLRFQERAAVPVQVPVRPAGQVRALEPVAPRARAQLLRRSLLLLLGALALLGQHFFFAGLRLVLGEDQRSWASPFQSRRGRRAATAKIGLDRSCGGRCGGSALSACPRQKLCMAFMSISPVSSSLWNAELLARANRSGLTALRP